MAYFDWTPALSVGVKTFDEQHKKLIDLINTMHEAMKSGHGRDRLDLTLEELKKYTVYHFEAEEQAMTQHGFPNLEAHRKEHEKLVSQVRDMDISREDVTTVDIMEFLKRWLTDHILGTDKKYSSFLNSKGLR